MPDLFFERHVPHLPERMFDLVSDLERLSALPAQLQGMDVRPRPGAGRRALAKMTHRASARSRRPIPAG